MNGSQSNLQGMLQSQFESSLDLYMMSQRMFDVIREENNRYNALLLGYQTDLKRSQIFGETVISMQWQRNDLYDELESARYFVILQAYDFKKRGKKRISRCCGARDSASVPRVVNSMKNSGRWRWPPVASWVPKPRGSNAI